MRILKRKPLYATGRNAREWYQCVKSLHQAWFISSENLSRSAKNLKFSYSEIPRTIRLRWNRYNGATIVWMLTELRVTDNMFSAPLCTGPGITNLTSAINDTSFFPPAFSVSKIDQFDWSHEYVIEVACNRCKIALATPIPSWNPENDIGWVHQGVFLLGWIDLLLKWKLWDVDWQLNRFGWCNSLLRCFYKLLCFVSD